MAGLATSLQLRTAQTLAMTPQLQQAIRLLQLSAIELRQELRTAVDQNPMLELDDSDQSASNMESIEELRDREDSHDDYDLFDNDSSVNMNDLAMQNAPDLREEEPVRRDEPKADTDFSEPSYSAGTRSRGMAIDDDSVYEGETTESLQDHLMWQLNLSPLSGTDRKVAEFVIDGINDSGYLTTTDEEILSFAQKLDPEYTAQDVSSVIKLIQHYDPTGVGSRNAREFLKIQLQALPDDTRYLHQALKMVDEYFELLVNHDFRGLCQKMSIKEEVLGEITRLIRSLKARPATGQVSGKSDFVIPDVVTYRRSDGTYSVELNPDSLPKVRINDRYRALADQARTERDRTFFKNNLQDANWLLQSLNKRNETLLKVARCIVEHQHDFLERGESHMHPMILNDVAEEIEMHESTISRVTTEKYIHTPRGTFELKYFFSSSVSTDDGGAASSTAIRARIREIIAHENPRKPCSDSFISEELRKDGLIVARRTVAKYRESLGIAPSSQRKMLV